MIQARKKPPLFKMEALAVKNYRSLKHVELRNLTPFSVFIGENATGKSALLDAFAFLSECVGIGIQGAVERRGGMAALKTWGQKGPVELAVKYRERPEAPPTIYHLAIEEGANGLYVAEEWMQWKRGLKGNVCRFLEFRNGKGSVIGGMAPHEHDQPLNEILENSSSLALSLFSQFSQYPRLTAFRNFLLNWQVDCSYGASLRGMPKAGLEEKMDEGVAQALAAFLHTHTLLGRDKEQAEILPQLASQQGLSQGLQQLIYQLSSLYRQEDQLLGLKYPEAALPPALLVKLAGEYRRMLEEKQLLVVTASPLLLDTMKPEEVWMLSVDSEGHTQAYRAADMPGIRECTQHGALLGQLWTEGYFSEQSML